MYQFYITVWKIPKDLHLILSHSIRMVILYFLTKKKVSSLLWSPSPEFYSLCNIMWSYFLGSPSDIQPRATVLLQSNSILRTKEKRSSQNLYEGRRGREQWWKRFVRFIATVFLRSNSIRDSFLCLHLFFERTLVHIDQSDFASLLYFMPFLTLHWFSSSAYVCLPLTKES